MNRIFSFLALFFVMLSASAQGELPAYSAGSKTVFYNADGRYTFDFSPTNHTPNWVAYKLTASDIGGDAGRANSFAADDAIASRGYRCATNADYAKSGYDRGHLLPSADRSRTKTENRATFLFGNVAPQKPALNRTSWRFLEEYIRKQAALCDTIYIICGGVTPIDAPTMGADIAIPTLFFKAFAIRKDAAIEKFAYVMPNIDTTDKFTTYQVTIDSIERLAGLKLFVNLK